MVAPVTGTLVACIEAAADLTVLTEGLLEEFSVIIEVV